MPGFKAAAVTSDPVPGTTILELTLHSFLPPPPPRYSAPIAYAAGTVNGMPVPITETSNVIKHPEGGCPLQVGEGIIFFISIPPQIHSAA